MAQPPSRKSRPRRRARRLSDAENIDRSVDSIDFYRRITGAENTRGDRDRTVDVDSDGVVEERAPIDADGRLSAEFWTQNRPPHHGD
ncbi:MULTISPECIES: hypothetical protein [unclassified Corynebacterium]|uniref:hypothetical protein n=1 Tax=unclassified Corynebacterium TaxID=2624378 RepID=UPI001C46EAE9|nr:MULTISPECIES: hypothetical protein [unclassified Corynebacterium]MBV7281332.1 hypothetical protein [Corynebacterium sp. TAE3-ERU30]MBV7301900.1 hypothetical protein [Corynebacterium sp. TAE3-ERU2]